MRQRNHGLRKRCGCPRTKWPKCKHGWHFNFRWKGVNHRLSLDRECGRHIDSKTKAQQEADRIRHSVRTGTLQQGSAVAKTPAGPSLSVSSYGAVFVQRYCKARGKASWKNDQQRLTKLAKFVLARTKRPIGNMSVASVTEDDCEVFLNSLKEEGLAASTRNKYLQLVKAMSAWGVRKGYLAAPWILPGSDLRREKHARRNRRLPFEEEQRLLSFASPRLYRLVVAAVETGCRQGELLSLQWRDVNLAGREIRIQASNAKDQEHRHIPISARLLAVLEMAQHDPAGHPLPPAAFVFGNAVGDRVTSPKKAWETAVLKAHGHTPHWTTGSNSLAPESQKAHREIDLRFHDLRHEAGSRWLEAGMPLHHVKELLGHANIATTDTYLNAGRIHLHESMLRLEAEGKVCTKFAQNPSSQPRPGPPVEHSGEPKSLVN